jgi:Family of unknown function (DUF6010)
MMRGLLCCHLAGARADEAPLQWIFVAASESSFGCAICDVVIALWCFANGPSLLIVTREFATSDGL